MEPPDAADSYQRQLLYTSVSTAAALEHPHSRVWMFGRSTTNSTRKRAVCGSCIIMGPPVSSSWSSSGLSGEEVGASGSSGGFCGVSSQYESLENVTLTCCSKVCSSGKQVVEKVETEHAQLEDGRFVYRFLRSRMCEFSSVQSFSRV